MSVAIIVEETKFVMPKQVFRENIQNIQEQISAMPESLGEDPFPLKHSFAEGMYIREINVPKHMLIVTKIHKHSHPVFLLKGDVSVLEETGVRRVKAPCYFITKAGTKRICFTHEETVWITCHATRKTNLKKIEQEVIAKTFDELPNEAEINKFITEIQKGEIE